MPRDRQTRRALLLLMGIVCSAVSTGCLRTAIVRPAQEPPAEPSSSGTPNPGDRPVAIPGAGQGQVDAPLTNQTPIPARLSIWRSLAGASPGIATSPATALAVTTAPPVSTPPKESSAVAPIQLEAAPIEPRSVPDSVEPRGVTATTPAADTPGASATPMLDAANSRVAAVTRQHRELLAAAAMPAAPEDGIPALVARRSPAVDAPASKTATSPLPAVATGSAASPGWREPTSAQNDASPAQPPAPAAPKVEPTAPIAPIEKEKSPEEPARDQPRDADHPPTNPASDSAAENCDPPGISELQLCRKVSGFGSFEPLNETSVKAGQPVLIYCEMTGLRYEAKDDGFVSRVSSRIEIRSAGGGPIQWEHELGAGEDVCRRRRHDYYVNYRFYLPKSLAPGSYDLRLTQTDLVANRSTSAEIPLNITR